jgi:hypothetical protein
MIDDTRSEIEGVLISKRKKQLGPSVKEPKQGGIREKYRIRRICTSSFRGFAYLCRAIVLKMERGGGGSVFFLILY